MKKDELKNIKNFIYNVLEIFQHQEEFLADDSGLYNFENPMFDKAFNYLLPQKKLKEKEVKKVLLVCYRCGETFKANALFDKNGVSINTMPRLCSKCIIEEKK